MIPEAREVHLSRKDRKVLEACCRSPMTLQRDLKRARIVLLAAAGRSTRSIAKEVGVQPRIVSLWRHRYADQGLEGLQDKPRPGKQPIYTKTTDKRILKLLDKPPPQGFARWTGPLLAEALGDVDVQYVWRFLRSHKIDLAARKSWCESNDPHFTAKAEDGRYSGCKNRRNDPRPLFPTSGEGDDPYRPARQSDQTALHCWVPTSCSGAPFPLNREPASSSHAETQSQPSP